MYVQVVDFLFSRGLRFFPSPKMSIRRGPSVQRFNMSYFLDRQTRVIQPRSYFTKNNLALSPQPRNPCLTVMCVGHAYSGSAPALLMPSNLSSCSIDIRQTAFSRSEKIIKISKNSDKPTRAVRHKQNPGFKYRLFSSKGQNLSVFKNR